MDELGRDVALLLHERAIERTLHRYCRGVDRLLPDVIRSCFHADAVDDHGTGPRTVDDLLAWVVPLLEGYAMTMHLLANVLVDVAPGGTIARAESYGVAHHRTGDTEPWEAGRNLVTGFRFVDRFEHRNGRWAIAHRVATTEWVTVDPVEQRWPVPDRFRRGTRDTTDPLHWLVPEVPAS